jgi:small-conductance mechanosensitive channel
VSKVLQAAKETRRAFAGKDLIRFFAGCVIAACVASDAGMAQEAAPQPAPAEGSPLQQVKIVPEARDEQIAERLRPIFDSTGWFESLNVAVRSGVVFLDGETAREEHRQWAARLAENTQGSVAVVNRIEVETDAEKTFGSAWQQLNAFFRSAVRAWPIAVLALVIFVVTWITARLVTSGARRVLARRIPSPLLLGVAARALAIPVFLLGLYFFLQIAGLTRLALTVLGGTGLIGIVLGFAFRDIAENFLASLLLSIRNPFRRGDLIEVEGRTGIVQNLNTRSTVLLTLEGTHIQIPNAIIYKSTIVNYSSNGSRRAEFVVGIGYDSSAAKAQSIIANVLKEHPAVLDAPEPLVLVDELGAASVNLRVFYWFDSAVYSPAKINSAILRLSKSALLQAGIELPDPAREVIFPRGVPLIHAAEREETKAGAALAALPPHEETSVATLGEGELSNETNEVRSCSEGQVPEAAENLLRGAPRSSRNGRIR